MNIFSSRRLGHTYRISATAACAVALGAVPGVGHAATTHSTEDFDFDADGLCAFTVHLTVHSEVDIATHRQDGGTVEIDHVTETDTVSANGRTVYGLPYHYSVRYTFDADGKLVDETSSGVIWRFRLPDGGVWSAGGHAPDLRNGVFVGSWVLGDDLGPVCDALAG